MPVTYLKDKKTASENAEICCSRQPHSRLTPPPRGTFTNIRINLISPETTVIGLHFAADSMGLSSFNSCGGLRKRIFSATECVSAVQGHRRSLIFGTNRKGICNFVLVINSNVSTTLHCFWDTATYWLKIAIFSYPLSFNALARCELFRISEWTLCKQKQKTGWILRLCGTFKIQKAFSFRGSRDHVHAPFRKKI